MIRPVAEVTIRPAIVADAGAIAAFNCALALETEAKALDPNTVLAGVQTLLTRDGLGFYLVAGGGSGARGLFAGHLRME